MRWMWITGLVLTLMAFAAPAGAKEADELRGRPVAEIFEALVSRDPQAKRGALHELQAAGAEAVPHLRRALSSTDPVLRTRVCEVLGDLGAIAAPAWLDIAELVLDDNTEVRFRALRALGVVGQHAAEKGSDADRQRVLHRLRVALKAVERKPRTKEASTVWPPRILTACLRMGSFTQDLQLELIAAPHGDERFFFNELWDERDAGELLQELLAHPSWIVRKKALQYLRVPAAVPEALAQTLAGAFDDASEGVAYFALIRFSGAVRARPDLGRHALVGFSSRHASIRTLTPVVIGDQVPWSADVERRLVAMLRDPAGSTSLQEQRRIDDGRIGAAWALGNRAATRSAVVPALLSVLDDEDTTLRIAAARSLVRLGERPGAAVEPLVLAANTSMVRAPYRLVMRGERGYYARGRRHLVMPPTSSAWKLLEEFGVRGGEALARHIAGMGEDRHGGARWNALHALGTLKVGGPVGLRTLLAHEDPEVCWRAALTLLSRDKQALDAVLVLLQAIEFRRPPPSTGDEEVREEPVASSIRVDWHGTAYEALIQLDGKLAPAVRDAIQAMPAVDRRRLAPTMNSWLDVRGQAPIDTK